MSNYLAHQENPEIIMGKADKDTDSEIRNKSEIRNPISTSSWSLIPISSLIVLVSFLVLDPESSWLLAISATGNFALLMWMLFKLYQWELLLSPVSILILGNGALLNYTIGNLGARIAGDTRYLAMPGSLDYYPTAALLSLIGLSIFSLVTFGLLSKSYRSIRIRYQDMVWKPYQSLGIFIMSLAIIVYLSSKYQFDNGYFQEVTSQVDRWLSASNHFFIRFSVLTSVSLMVRYKSASGKILGAVLVLIILVVAIGLRSRTFMVEVTTLIALCWITLEPKKVKPIVIGSCIVASVVFFSGSLVKYMNTLSARNSSIFENIGLINSPNLENFTQASQDILSLDVEYRMAGLELSAAILKGFDLGVTPMLGEAMKGGLIQGLPNFLRPPGSYSERVSIFRHFVNRGLVHDEAISIPLSSGLADFGIYVGPFVYILISFYCLLLWRLAQLSPRFFLAVVATGAGPGDLFWHSAFLSIRTIGFTWLAIYIFSFLCMPTLKDFSSGRDKFSIRHAISKQTPKTEKARIVNRFLQ